MKTLEFKLRNTHVVVIRNVKDSLATDILESWRLRKLVSCYKTTCTTCQWGPNHNCFSNKGFKFTDCASVKEIGDGKPAHQRTDESFKQMEKDHNTVVNRDLLRSEFCQDLEKYKQQADDQWVEIIRLRKKDREQAESNSNEFGNVNYEIGNLKAEVKICSNEIADVQSQQKGTANRLHSVDKEYDKQIEWLKKEVGILGKENEILKSNGNTVKEALNMLIDAGRKQANVIDENIEEITSLKNQIESLRLAQDEAKVIPTNEIIIKLINKHGLRYDKSDGTLYIEKNVLHPRDRRSH